MAQPLDFPRHIPFVEHLGVQLWNLDDGRCELRLQLQDHQMNSMLAAHGGVVMTLLDVAMAHAARSSAADRAGAAGVEVDKADKAEKAEKAEKAAQAGEAVAGAADSAARAQGVVTIEMKTSFMRASHGALRAEGLLLHRTATMAFCEGSVFNADGALCAHATGTFKYVSGVAGHAVRQAAEQAAQQAAAAAEAQDIIQQAASADTLADQPSKDTTA